MTGALDTVRDHKTTALTDVLTAFFNRPIGSILVVGCGAGREAGVLARAFNAEVTGIDVGQEFAFDHRGAAPAKLMLMDARELAFADASFDMVFSFHALEHIPQRERALAEMKRVLKPGGAYMIGTPNKHRLLGYIGSAQPLSRKILWNLEDVGMRLTGRWSNEAGAHAGFSARELYEDCARTFGNATDISDLYYRRAYQRKGRMVDSIIKSGLKPLFFPCVYMAGTKSAA